MCVCELNYVIQNGLKSDKQIFVILDISVTNIFIRLVFAIGSGVDVSDVV